MRATVAVTGGTGFVGKEIIRLLNTYNFRIKVLLRKKSIHKLSKQQIDEVVYGDLSNDKALSKFVENADYIVHCAGKVRGISKNSFIQTNLKGLSRLALYSARYNKHTRFLHISSLVAQKPEISPYAFSKQRSETALEQILPNRDWTIFRPSIVYGPEDREVLPLLKFMRLGIFPVLSHRENRYSFIHVHDLARAVLSWIKSEDCKQKTYELHDGKANGYSWREIFEILGTLNNKTIKSFRIPAQFLYTCAYANISIHSLIRRDPMLSPGKVRELIQPSWTCENTSFSKDTGWLPEIDLKKGLRELGSRNLIPDKF